MSSTEMVLYRPPAQFWHTASGSSTVPVEPREPKRRRLFSKTRAAIPELPSRTEVLEGADVVMAEAVKGYYSIYGPVKRVFSVENMRKVASTVGTFFGKAGTVFTGVAMIPYVKELLMKTVCAGINISVSAPVAVSIIVVWLGYYRGDIKAAMSDMISLKTGTTKTGLEVIKRIQASLQEYITGIDVEEIKRTMRGVINYLNSKEMKYEMQTIWGTKESTTEEIRKVAVTSLDIGRVGEKMSESIVCRKEREPITRFDEETVPTYGEYTDSQDTTGMMGIGSQELTDPVSDMEIEREEEKAKKPLIDTSEDKRGIKRKRVGGKRTRKHRSKHGKKKRKTRKMRRTRKHKSKQGKKKRKTRKMRKR